MRKRIVVWGLVCLGLVAWAVPAVAADAGTVDVVYLKNGSQIRGSIVEEVPGKQIKIRTADGSLFVYDMAQVVRITRREAPAPAPSGASVAPGAAAPAAGGHPLPAIDLVINPLGLLQFGPIVDLELRATPGLYLLLHLRFHGLGVISHVMESYTLSIPSFAGGTGLRYFFTPQTGSTGYLGFVVEVGHNWFTEGYEDTYITFVANGGYRWTFGSTMMNLGAYLGAAQTVANDLPDALFPLTPVAMLELSFAWGL